MAIATKSSSIPDQVHQVPADRPLSEADHVEASRLRFCRRRRQLQDLTWPRPPTEPSLGRNVSH